MNYMIYLLFTRLSQLKDPDMFSAHLLIADLKLKVHTYIYIYIISSSKFCNKSHA